MDKIFRNIADAIESGIKKAHENTDLATLIDRHLVAVRGNTWVYNIDIGAFIRKHQP